MEYTYLKNGEIKAPRVGLGTWAIGGWMWGGPDNPSSLQTIRAALDLGINLIDTAPIYGFGLSEELVGEAISDYGQRDKVVIATKAGLEWPNGSGVRNSSRSRLLTEIEDSLRRLKTDYIDIYQLHWPDPLVPLEETAELLNGFYQQGKIRAIGVSNFSLEEMTSFRSAAPLHCAQPPYNLFERAAETSVLPYCRKHNINSLVYGPLCRGLLTGKFQPATSFGKDDVRSFDPKFQSPRFENYLRCVERLDQFAQENYGKRVIHLAIRWLLDQPHVDVVLWGARRPSQIAAVPEVLGWKLDNATMQMVDQIILNTIPEPIGLEFMAASRRQKTDP